MEIGDHVPNATVITETGAQHTLDELRNDQVAVLFFYPKDESPICTIEACSFRDAYQDFVTAQAVVIGVSSDSAVSHQAFRENHNLPYTLIADKGGMLRKAFDVPKRLGFLEGRVTYVIDRDGIIQHIFNAPFSAAPHVAEALTVVHRLQEDAVSGLDL
ncbi:MAG TPA: peroxiredoxin [Rhodothermales bacterium]|nr:peroxiredoxin [Rhodothermales bacterium]